MNAASVTAVIDVLLLEGMVNGHKPPQGQITVSTVSPTRVYVRLFDLDVFLNNHIILALWNGSQFLSCSVKPEWIRRQRCRAIFGLK